VVEKTAVEFIPLVRLVGVDRDAGEEGLGILGDRVIVAQVKGRFAGKRMREAGAEIVTIEGFVTGAVRKVIDDRFVLTPPGRFGPSPTH